MKTEFVEVSDTRKSLVVEVPSGVVDAEIERVTRDYSRAARIPGFRPGKVPVALVKQRFRDQILHDVAQGLIPRAVDEALRTRGVEPIDTPHIRDVVVEEGQPLTFTAAFETVPPIDPGDYSEITLRRPPAVVEDDEVERALERLRERAARHDPVEDRSIEPGDTVLLDLERSVKGEAPERHESVAVDLGAASNPRGFDDHLVGLRLGARTEFTLVTSADPGSPDRGALEVHYRVVVKDLRRRVLPALDDEFAKDLDFETLAALRRRVRQDLFMEAEQAADRQLRMDLLATLARRLQFEVPATLVERELDRRSEDFARQLTERQIDPRRTNVNWRELREAQREAASLAVGGALVLDEVARHENLGVTEEEIDREVGRYAERTGRAAAAVRAQLDKNGGLARVALGLRREKAVDFVLAHATIAIG